MRRFLSTDLMVSVGSVLLLMALAACGGGDGGDDSGEGEANQVTLTGVTIDGPSTMNEYDTATYSATAQWSDGSTSAVVPNWSINSQGASIGPDGVLCCEGIDNDEAVTVTATYGAGGITATATKDVTLLQSAPISFTTEELSGKAFFEEASTGGYPSHLYVLNADSSLDQYGTFTGDWSAHVSGTWSNDEDGLHLNRTIVDYGPATVQRISESLTEMTVEFYDQIWHSSWVVTWEKIVPVVTAKLPGTYTDGDGETWVFHSDGTGTSSAFGGFTFTWSVDSDGVLRMLSSGRGYSTVFYARATSQSSASEYSVLKVGFLEDDTSTETFHKYYGGLSLTRQAGAGSPTTLTGLTIGENSSISEYGTDTFTATAHWSDGSTSVATPTWSVSSPMAAISPFGVFSCQQEIDSDQTVTISAAYSSGGITQTDTMEVTIIDFTYMENPFFDHFIDRFLSGMVFFDEHVDADGMYESTLYIFKGNFSFDQYDYSLPPETSQYVTGTWNIDAAGKAVLNYVGGKTITWQLLDPWITTWILVDDGTGTPSTVDLEMSGPGPYPFQSSILPGTYVNQYGDTWIFDAGGRGSTTSEGGSTFMWSVEEGILKVRFPNGSVGWMYERPSPRPAESYTPLEWAYVLYGPDRQFSFYYGGMHLTRL